MSGVGVVELALVGLAPVFLVVAVRTLRGPSDADRAVGAELGYFALIAAVALLAARAGEPAFLDVVLVATVVGFISSLTLAGLVHRRER